MSKISWLHLSDMHISANNSFDQNLIHDSLFRDLESQLDKFDIELNFIFFTGDVAYTASKEDYELAVIFFNNLCERFNFNKSNLFIVPGNHDVNRYKVSKILDDNRRQLGAREEIKEVLENHKILDSYLSRFDNYSEFISALYGTTFKMSHENYYFSEARTINGTEFGVIGLNSAWASYGGRHDCNNIYISEIQLSHAIEKVKQSPVKIVLLHHPLSWLYEEDKADIENLLYQNCHIILHGHLHRADFQIVNSIKGQQIIIPAGAIFTGRRISNSYNITTLDSEKGTINIVPRRYYDGPRKFLKDIESLGNDEINYFEAEIPRTILRTLN
jgi:predicted phosphodiesterase